MKSLEILLSF